MRTIFVTLIVLLTFQANGQNLCRSVFLPQKPVKSKVLFDSYYELTTGQELYVKIEKPSGRKKPKGWFFMVHGLMDSHMAWKDMAPHLLKKGYGIVRLDLEGFARSLERNLEKSALGTIPTVISYEKQVENLIEILRAIRIDYSIEKPFAVGHSMGGGLVIALAGHPAGRELIHSTSFVFSPYVYRLELRAIEKLYPPMVSEHIHLADLTKWIPKAWLSAMEAATSDQMIQKFMEQQFSRFFEEKLIERDIGFKNETEKQKAINKHVEAGIAAVKGLRSLDATVIASRFSSEQRVIQVVGKDDQLLDAVLQHKLAGKIKDGEYLMLDAGHMVINEKAAESAYIILNELGEYKH